MASAETEPTGLAKGNVYKGEEPSNKEGLDLANNGGAEKCKAEADRLASSPVAEPMLNGTECDDARHNSPTCVSTTGHGMELALVNENGTSDMETPHGSVTGSNGFILIKPQQEDSSEATPDMTNSPHRTNRPPSNTPTGVHLTKSPPSSASGSPQTLGALRTDPITGTTTELETIDSKNGTAATTTASTTIMIHRARKTMSRPAVTLEQKFLVV
ncbi:uncharacterized protein LOC109527060 [Hippocampus comes]|uniref:uncharacterized protein LOC109527060 n=1 Tax=Hippocampus comes TaxID=109280 RepID=UPI00094E4FEF|nr:PREDICTED: uncharacterized protein LOC109527060 [Hippocampus comes]